MSKYLLFSYGSNMNDDQLLSRAPLALAVGTGVLRKYRLEFVGRGVATVCQDENSEVPGTLTLLDDLDFARMHAFEGVPWVYRRKLRPIQTERGVKFAWTFIHNSNRLARPADDYIMRILVGAEDHGIDSEHIWKAYERAFDRVYEPPTINWPPRQFYPPPPVESPPLGQSKYGRGSSSKRWERPAESSSGRWVSAEFGEADEERELWERGESSSSSNKKSHRFVQWRP